MVLETASIWLEAFNPEQCGTFKAQLHSKVVFTQRDNGRVNEGAEEVCSSFYNWRAGHTQLHGHIIDRFGSGERAVLEVHWTGTNMNGEAVDFYACLLFRSRDGKFIEIVDYY